MTVQSTTRRRRPAGRRYNWPISILAIWLFVSPWVLNFGGVVDGGGAGINRGAAMAAAWDAWVAGVVVFLLSMVVARRAGAKWLNILFAVWIFIAPWVLGFAGLTAASWDHWISGAILALAALIGTVSGRRIHAPLD